MHYWNYFAARKKSLEMNFLLAVNWLYWWFNYAFFMSQLSEIESPLAINSEIEQKIFVELFFLLNFIKKPAMINERSLKTAQTTRGCRNWHCGAKLCSADRSIWLRNDKYLFTYGWWMLKHFAAIDKLEAKWANTYLGAETFSHDFTAVFPWDWFKVSD